MVSAWLSHCSRWTLWFFALLTAHTVHCQTLVTSGRVTGSAAQVAGVTSPPVVMSWSADSVQQAFDSSESITASFQALPDSSDPSAVLFRFSVDGDYEVQQIAVPYGISTWSRSGLSSGQHSLTITRLNEAVYGPVVLTNVSLASTGRFTEPVLQPSLSSGRRMLFLGDSITSGWGANGDSSCGSFQLGSKSLLAVDTEDVAVTYPWLVAEAFSADPQIIAWTGATQNPYPSWESAQLTNIYPATIPQLWHEAIAGNASSQADLSSWVPQVVILAGGANDFHVNPPLTPMDDWVAQYIAFIKQVQATYGGSLQATVVVAWSRAQLDLPLPDDQTSNYLQYEAALQQAIVDQGLTDTHFLQLTANGMPLTGWCAAHPNAGAHANIASQIQAFLQAQASSWAGASFSPTVQLSSASFATLTTAG